MVKGFKDRDGKFHPISQSKGVRKSRVRYANDSGLSEILSQGAKDFARLNRDRYNDWKSTQNQKFQEDLDLRRKFRVALIRSFRLARAQEITRPKELEKFIRQNIPDLPQGKKTNRFVEKVLGEFIREEKRFKEKIKGKSEAEQKQLNDAFEMALTESEAVFKKIEAERDDKFAQQEKQDHKKWLNKIEKLQNEAKQHKEAEKQHQKDIDELNKRMNQGAPKEDVKESKAKAEQSEKKADTEQKQETTFAQDVFDEMAKDQEKSENKDFKFGFPSEIV
ncbi:MAG: hypothetical protein KJI69_03835 [Patescibacteria group bacterium]|nr:hypothetical protein [Patescibacteria group bacterium]